MTFFSWGNYPAFKPKKIFNLKNTGKLKSILSKEKGFIAYGNGKSYGDSALSQNIIDTRLYNYFLDFDAEKGLLHLQAGVLLSEIIDIFVPQGWFLKVVPGTKLITVGGAIAADIHGKNHHKAGCFSQSVKMFRLQLPNGEVIRCSKTKNKELFLATCGGMGLTGIILDVKIFLKKISSQYIKQTTVKTKNLKETFEAFENYKEKPYSVAWIDCLAKDKKLGRCLLMIGDFCQDQNLNYKQKRKINISFYCPSFILNKHSVKIFNWFYYHKVRKPIPTKKYL